MSERKERIKALKQEIDQLEAEEWVEANGNGLARLKEIVGETGYFRVRNSFYSCGNPASIVELDIVGHYEIGIDGYNFSVLGERYGEVTAETQDYLTCFPSDLEGWESIPAERFYQAARDYENIKALVKEAMKP